MATAATDTPSKPGLAGRIFKRIIAIPGQIKRTVLRDKPAKTESKPARAKPTPKPAAEAKAKMAPAKPAKAKAG